MSEERMRILKMLEEKKITAGDADKLLAALGWSGGESGASQNKALHIRVFEKDMGEPKVNINVPLGWTKFVGSMIPAKVQEKLNEKGININMQEVMEAVHSGKSGKLVDVKDEDKKVEIWIE